MIAEFGKIYSFTVNGEPVPKSTQKPPRHKAAYHIVQKDPKYKRLKDTWAYQKSVAESAMAAGIPQFDKDDPIELSATIYKSGRKMGDIKNIIAAIEDGLQYGGFVPNDKQVVAYNNVNVIYGCGKKAASVAIHIRISAGAESIGWLEGYFPTNKKAQEYYDRRIANAHAE